MVWVFEHKENAIQRCWTVNISNAALTFTKKTKKVGWVVTKNRKKIWRNCAKKNDNTPRQEQEGCISW